MKISHLILLLHIFLGSHASSQAQLSSKLSEHFIDTWYQGTAEISTYRLHQARYGELHQGDAVLIYVTEDFSRKKQVKLDYPHRDAKYAVPILKLNHRRTFNTGIYPYALMTSVFTPVDMETYPHSLKTTTTVQEWCGHTFMQFNLDNSTYKVTGFSYFESEGDQEQQVKADWIEDELWTRLRLQPQSLPIGEINIIPSQQFLRLRHKPIRSYKAVTSLSKGENGLTSKYSVVYQDLQRELHIEFKSSFPYEIQGWTERYKSGFGTYAGFLETKATLHKRIWTDYWTQNRKSDLNMSYNLLPDMN